jgi:hypothetical protein
MIKFGRCQIGYEQNHNGEKNKNKNLNSLEFIYTILPAAFYGIYDTI